MLSLIFTADLNQIEISLKHQSKLNLNIKYESIILVSTLTTEEITKRNLFAKAECLDDQSNWSQRILIACTKSHESSVFHAQSY